MSISVRIRSSPVVTVEKPNYFLFVLCPRRKIPSGGCKILSSWFPLTIIVYVCYVTGIHKGRHSTLIINMDEYPTVLLIYLFFSPYIIRKLFSSIIIMERDYCEDKIMVKVKRSVFVDHLRGHNRWQTGNIFGTRHPLPTLPKDCFSETIFLSDLFPNALTTSVQNK